MGDVPEDVLGTASSFDTVHGVARATNYRCPGTTQVGAAPARGHERLSARGTAFDRASGHFYNARMRILLLSLLVTIGCASTPGSGPLGGPPANFQKATMQQLGAVLDAATGRHAWMSAFDMSLALADYQHPPSCPAIQNTGSTWTLTGGCTDLDDATWSGKATISNAPGFNGQAAPSYDSSRPTTIAFDMWSVAGGGSGTTLDGTVDYTDLGLVSAGDSYPAFRSLVSALTVTTAHLTTTEQVHLALDPTGWSLTQPSWLELDGLGGATLSGAWSDGRTPSGTLTVHGADDLVFDFTQLQQECVGYTIGTKTGVACPL